jgi:hypothetical protein
VLCGEIRKTPDVAKTNRRACGGKNKAELTGKISSFFKGCVFTHKKTSQNKFAYCNNFYLLSHKTQKITRIILSKRVIY